MIKSARFSRTKVVPRLNASLEMFLLDAFLLIGDIMKKPIKTQRLLLRDVMIEDTISMFEYAQDKETGPMAGWRPHGHIAETKQIIESMIEADNVYAIILDEKMIGTVGFTKTGVSYEIGYVIAKPHWNKGIATEATKALMIYLFEMSDAEKIIIKHALGNIRSQRVIEKLGLVKIKEETKDFLGEQRILYVYEMTKTSYEKGALK